MNIGIRIADASRRAEARSRRRPDDPARVLLAEDDVDLRRLVAAALRMDHYDVIEVADGRALAQQVVEWLEYRWPYQQLDLIVADVRMPGHSGTEVVTTLRDSHWDTPVILMTAYADARLFGEAIDLDVLAVLQKPFEIDDLRACVSSAIPWRRASRPGGGP